jgi:LPS sulfotransferase NodH
MESGRFLAEGAPQEFFNKGQENEWIRGFLNRLL